MCIRDRKYGAFNWRTEGPLYTTTYLDAAVRHLFAMMDGDDTDESGFPHAAHVAACMVILMDAKSKGCLHEDRPTVTEKLAE